MSCAVAGRPLSWVQLHTSLRTGRRQGKEGTSWGTLEERQPLPLVFLQKQCLQRYIEGMVDGYRTWVLKEKDKFGQRMA